MAARRKVGRKRPIKPLPLAEYLRRYGVPPKGHPRRAGYERSTVGKARARAAAKAAETRTRKRAEVAAKGLDRWSRALDKARDLDTKRAWREFRRLDKLRLEQEKSSTAWKRMLRRMLRERADVFGIDPDAYDVE